MDLRDVITPFKVGLLVLAGIAATVFMVVNLTETGGADLDEGTRLYAMFDDVTGLAVNSRVRMSGIAVGTLADIELAGKKARVTVVIDEEIEMHQGIEQPDGYYKGGATIGPKQASFIGDYYLEITPGERGPVLEDDDEIKNVIAPPSMDEIFNKLNRISSNIEKVTESLANVFGGEEGQKKLDEILINLTETLGATRKLVTSSEPKLNRILTDAQSISGDVRALTSEGASSISQILKDTQVAVRDVRVIISQASGDVQAGIGTLKGSLARLQTTLDSLNYSLQNIQDITDKINEGEGTLGALVNDPAIADQTERILGDVESISGPLADLQTIIQLRSEYHFTAQQFKTVVGLRLQPHRNKYYLIELVDAYRGDTTVTNETIYQTGSDEDPVRDVTTETTSDTFKFSFQYARTYEIANWLAITGRFGFIESSGGLGGNLLLFEDRTLDLQVDVFDFSLDVSPRVRMFLSWRMFSNALILAGVDDILNDGSRSWFLGAGLRFTDEDLKALVTATGVPSP
jgi:phospholipid/cholesterol/gamma-HCH transport system substrate-binding protein